MKIKKKSLFLEKLQKTAPYSIVCAKMKANECTDPYKTVQNLGIWQKQSHHPLAQASPPEVLF